MNYPRLWLLPAQFGFGSSSNTYLAIAFVIGFFVSVFVIVGPVSPRQALYYVLVLVSAPVMLLIERGNNDLVIFMLLVGTAATLAWNARLGATNAAALIFLATTLKLYPIAAVHSLFLSLRTWRWQLLSVAVIVAGAAYAFLIRQDLALISSATPRSTVLAYGLNVPIRRALDDFDASFNTRTADWIELALRGLALLFLVGLALAAVRTLARNRFVVDTPRARFVGLLFSMGAAIYVVTFILGNNWDYRLTLLLLCLPQLFEWMGSPRLVNEARLVLVIIAASFWIAEVTTYPLYWVDQLAFYALFVYFAAVLIIETRDHVAMLLSTSRFAVGDDQLTQTAASSAARSV
jgi:hypothetical protein